MKRFWMRSLIGQWLALMLLTLAVVQLLFSFFYRQEQARTVQELRRDEFLSRAASSSRLLMTVDPALHPEILKNSSTFSIRFWLTDGPPQSPAEWQSSAKENLLASARPPTASDLVVHEDAQWTSLTDEGRFGALPVRLMELKSWNGLGVSVPLKDGAWLNGIYAKPLLSPGPPPSYYASLVVTALLLSLVAVIAARRVGRPLQRLTDAAEKFGRGEMASTVPEEGPDDLRRVSSAFNLMQSRMRRFVEDRTRMVAAISHDLRTPITSMRLRAEFIEDEEMRGKFISTLDEMKAMTEATLAFAAEEAATEDTRPVEMNALLGSLCADLQELGWNVVFQETDRIVSRCRPEALRRAFRNVIENAIRYGNEARVSMKRTDDTIDIVVEDDGPGVSPGDREKIFEPFLRLESSRNRNTGGAGLGLSIARSILRNHGGDIDLPECQRGLRVRLRLPGGDPVP